MQPDVFVVPPEEARTLTWSRMRTLLLVAEVVSPHFVPRPPAPDPPVHISSACHRGLLTCA